MGRHAMGLLLGGFAVLLLALAVLSGWQGAARLGGRDDDTRAVQDAAGAFAAAYGTFDALAPDTYRARLLPLTTGRLHAAVLQLQADPAAVGQQHTLVTDILGVQLTSLSGGQATADVTVDQRRHAVDPTTGGAWEDRVRARLTCRMQRVGGRWLVESVRLTPIASPSRSVQ